MLLHTLLTWPLLPSELSTKPPHTGRFLCYTLYMENLTKEQRLAARYTAIRAGSAPKVVEEPITVVPIEDDEEPEEDVPTIVVGGDEE